MPNHNSPPPPPPNYYGPGGYSPLVSHPVLQDLIWNWRIDNSVSIVVQQTKLRLVTPNQFSVGAHPPTVAQRCHAVLLLLEASAEGSWPGLGPFCLQDQDGYCCPLTGANGIRITIWHLTVRIYKFMQIYQVGISCSHSYRGKTISTMSHKDFSTPRKEIQLWKILWQVCYNSNRLR